MLTFKCICCKDRSSEDTGEISNQISGLCLIKACTICGILLICIAIMGGGNRDGKKRVIKGLHRNQLKLKPSFRSIHRWPLGQAGSQIPFLTARALTHRGELHERLPWIYLVSIHSPFPILYLCKDSRLSIFPPSGLLETEVELQLFLSHRPCGKTKPIQSIFTSACYTVTVPGKASSFKIPL